MGLNDGTLIQASDKVFRDLTELNAKSAEMIGGIWKYGVEHDDILELKEIMDRLLSHGGRDE